MKKFASIVLLILIPGVLAAAEGKWTPEQVLRLDSGWLKQQGLRIPRERLWDPKRETGLLAGAVSIGGCSAAFISETGLIITNHHCIFSILQQHSTPQNDIITNGFLARTRAEELPGSGMRVAIPRRFVDVTREVLAAVPAGADDLARYRSIEAKEKQLVAACEKQRASRCSVSVFDGGVKYVLIDALEIADVRLVYAPPRAVGEFGGEVDNWSWPRHTGDFGIARAYVAPDGKAAPYGKSNVPLEPEFFFPISRTGVAPGDFVMVMGYPGSTYRSLIADEMAERRDLFYPRRAEIYGEWIGILENSTKGNPEGTIAVAATLKSLLNTCKNAQGQLAGFKRGRILEKQRAAEEAVAAWAANRPEFREALQARQGLIDLVKEQHGTWEHDFLLHLAPSGPKILYYATTLAHIARERKKPDLERDPEAMERNLRRVRERLEREEKSYFEAADKNLFQALVKRALALPAGQRIAAIDTAKIDSLYVQTKVLQLSERLKMFGETEEQLHARQDPVLELGFALDTELRALRKKQERWLGRTYRLRPLWRSAVLAHAGKPVAPDANGTLRVSFAHVAGYSPRDGIFAKPQTTLAGVLEKDTGVEPFQVPAAIRRAAEAHRFGPWKDPLLGDVPVNFLADADTTGGNSGSPVVNGKGELVGVNFDRVWENVANDFGYNPDVARNVSADVRYLLWLLDQVAGADSLLRELGVRK